MFRGDFKGKKSAVTKLSKWLLEGMSMILEQNPVCYFAWSSWLLFLLCILATPEVHQVIHQFIEMFAKYTLAIILKYLLSGWKSGSTGVRQNFTIGFCLQNSLAIILKFCFQEENLALLELGRILLWAFVALDFSLKSCLSATFLESQMQEDVRNKGSSTAKLYSKDE